MAEQVWSARDTTPADVEAALRKLLQQHLADSRCDTPARVLNLIAVVDREWSGEISNRLDRVGRYHASRTLLIAVEGKRTTIDAQAAIVGANDDGEGTTHERVVLTIGEQQLPYIDTIVDPLVVSDIPTLVWSPHGHDDAIDALMPLSQIVLFDTVDSPELEAGLRRARELADSAYVVDLAWLRSTPWRERIAAAFDPPTWRSQLGAIDSVHIRHHPESGAAGVLLIGWLATRLGWKPGRLSPKGRNGGLHGRAKTRRAEISLELEPHSEQDVRGLAGITIGTAQGLTLSLDRGPGGLRAKRQTRKGGELEWTIMGASRGESGILGEGIRQALLRDSTYRPALDAATEMVA
jgi:glucose-6-phosphate dehydrogenase assembly protein OpcA